MDDAQTIYRQEIEERLDSVAFHYKERDTARRHLQIYTGRDLHGTTSKTSDAKQITQRMRSAEISALSELVHLVDNFEKYLGSLGVSCKSLSVITNSKPYKVAANFINTRKHGTYGRGKISAKTDIFTPIFHQTGTEAVEGDYLLDVKAYINFDGDLYMTDKVVDELIEMWRNFIRSHPGINLAAFEQKIREVADKQAGSAVYSARDA